MTKRTKVLCTSCEEYVYTDSVHSCFDRKQVRAVRDAERAVITKAVAWEFAFRDPSDPMGVDVDLAHDALLSAVRALNAATGAG